MKREQTDILVSGGGVAGLVATIAFASHGFRTICVDPVPPVTEAAADGSDLRSTAFLQPSVRLMKEIGLWPRLAPYAAPLRIMRLADAGGPEPEIREVRDFVADDLGEEAFGYNLPNWLLRREMVAHLEAMPNADLRMGTALSQLLTRQTEALATLSDGTALRAQMVIGADGRNSFVREALGIGAKTTRYGQKAIVFAVSHPVPHDDISTEIHRTGGPFTLVPLPDAEGQHHSAIVWMETGPKATALMAMDEAAFTEALNIRACGVLGDLTLASPRRIWPIITQKAERLTGPRTALIAEAAHVMPPIGAQGLNMSLRDITTLLSGVTTARETGQDWAGAPVLAAYARAREVDIAARLKGIDMLNRAAMAEAQPLRDLRLRGLTALHGLGPVRQVAMRMGLGAGQN
ncbi:2-octaprenyl-6-methoxyphenol hydroxylase [Rubricella aquisinus]|uniref:2-octaprenyl-6-methoxyphenol hydroxylase n=1 Tax=Rubricella aquisinus TaxID=2028108 RepID=A0A840WNR4_9RHOB|nr:UbiH/UbiF family hydroxylase [Rubricella aquisinus]MBB5516261.1 2-octaprenyl-6-methoxyphenol hydroxylase [Rubricella aquisinus]